MSDKMKTPLALMVQPVSEYGVRRIVARVVVPQEDGELHNPPMWDYSGRDNAQFDGFEITCYLGDTSMGSTNRDSGRLWGFGHSYDVHRIERPEHARAIAAVLTKVQRHLDKANTEDGYLSEGDFHGYVLRIAAALKIRDVYVRNLPRQAAMVGQKYGKVTGSALQSWLWQVSDHAGKNQLADIGL